MTPPFSMLLRKKPNCSMIAMESLIMFKRNKIAKWLQSKSEEEKEKITLVWVASSAKLIN